MSESFSDYFLSYHSQRKRERDERGENEEEERKGNGVREFSEPGG